MHDHPYLSVSIVLRGGYIETTAAGLQMRAPGDVVLRWPTELHAIAEIGSVPAVTLFLVGPRVRVWGFLCRTGWRPYHEASAVVDGVSTVQPWCEP
jgi:hypothetical protein